MTTEQLNPAFVDSIDHGWENERFARIPVMNPSSCVMFFGKRGSGKSAVMAKMGKDEARLGRKVWYWPPDFNFKYGEPIELLELASMPDYLYDGALLIDEIQIMASNLRTISTANQMVGSILQQVRKRGLNVYGTSNQPGRIDQTVSLQTDFHFDCFMMEDPRCSHIGYHRKDCRDHVRMRWTDTNGYFGYDKRHKDGRRRGRAIVWNIRDIYATYNTRAIADLGDVMSVTKASILQISAQKQNGLSNDELVERLRDEWVPQMVKDGTKRIAAGMIAKSITDQLGIKVAAVTVGKALSQLGITSTVLSSGRFAMLPPVEKLAQWQREGHWDQE